MDPGKDPNPVTQVDQSVHRSWLWSRINASCSADSNHLFHSTNQHLGGTLHLTPGTSHLHSSLQSCFVLSAKSVSEEWLFSS